MNVHDLGSLNNLFVYVVIHIQYRTIRVYQIYFNCAQELSKDLPIPDKKSDDMIKQHKGRVYM